MADSDDPCQVPSTDASRVGSSGSPPPQYHESRFVADQASGMLDTVHRISAPGQLVTVCLQTTRYVGTIDSEGFLVHAQQHIDQGTLAEKLLLTIRARIFAIDAGGQLGLDGLSVEVFLHKGTPHERSLGTLQGGWGMFDVDWQDFELEVDVRDVKFPADPCPGQSPTGRCGRRLAPASNEITFEFTGSIFPNMRLSLEVDWLMLEPKDAPGLAWRPVLLVHGVGATSTEMSAGTAWADELQARDVAHYAVDLTPTGLALENGVEIGEAVDDMKQRFGVDRVHIVGHSKGGLDARCHVKYNNHVETLIMLATPNAGSFIADIGERGTRGAPLIRPSLYFDGFLDLTTAAVESLNRSTFRNRRTNYVTVAGDYDSSWATRFAIFFGPNDEIVAVDSVEALSYADARTYLTSEADPISQGICRDQGLFNHSCLRYNTRVVDELFPLYLAVLTPPLPDPGVAHRTPGRLREGSPIGAQGVMSGGGAVLDGVTSSHLAVVDAAGAVAFVVLGDPDQLRLELVTSAGTRVDATTPSVDPAVTFAAFPGAGPLSYAGYHVEAPEVGTWTLEVTGTGVTAPEGSQYAVGALVPPDPGGVLLTARTDRVSCPPGGTVTIAATITRAGLPVPDATVEALVAHPDGSTRTQVALAGGAPDDGEYTGAFTASQVGLHSVVVTAVGTDPAFSREQLLVVQVAGSGSAFDGLVSDHGADTDGDGFYDELVIEIGVTVDVAAAYRVLGTLTTSSGSTVDQVQVEQELQPGGQTVSLRFAGAPLFALGQDGPYEVQDLLLEEVATSMTLDQGPAHVTAAYAHTEFQRPVCVLTGNVSDHGAHAQHMDQLPYEELVISVEVDLLVGAPLTAGANLHAEDGTFITAGSARAVLPPGPGVLEFHFDAFLIFRSGMPGPYTLRLMNIWGTTGSEDPDTDGAGESISLRVPGVVTVTQPYALADFAESPSYVVSGTVTGLVGFGMRVELVGPERSVSIPVSPPSTTFAFPFMALFSGNPYEVRVVRQPTNPVQVCSVENATGVIGTSDVSDVVVRCV